MNQLDRRRRLLAVGLAGLAGYVDAIGFLSADGYFISFMSGNTTRLGVNLARQPERAVMPALLIAGFVCGVALGAIVAARAGDRRKPAVLALVAALLAGGALAPTILPDRLSLALLVGAMGALNNTFQRDGEVSVGLTYMTGALVKLGQAIGAALGGQPRRGWQAQMLLWCGLAMGAVLGSAAFLRLGPGVLWAGVGWSLILVRFAAKLEPTDAGMAS